MNRSLALDSKSDWGVTPIDNWPKIEAGVTPLFNRDSTEWDIVLLFKKPWTLSDKVEFMAGVGPEWIHTSEHGLTTNATPRRNGGRLYVLGPLLGNINSAGSWNGLTTTASDVGISNQSGISGGLLIGVGTQHTKSPAEFLFAPSKFVPVIPSATTHILSANVEAAIPVTSTVSTVAP